MNNVRSNFSLAGYLTLTQRRPPGEERTSFSILGRALLCHFDLLSRLGYERIPIEILP